MCATIASKLKDITLCCSCKGEINSPAHPKRTLYLSHLGALESVTDHYGGSVNLFLVYSATLSTVLDIILPVSTSLSACFVIWASGLLFHLWFELLTPQLRGESPYCWVDAPQIRLHIPHISEDGPFKQMILLVPSPLPPLCMHWGIRTPPACYHEESSVVRQVDKLFRSLLAFLCCRAARPPAVQPPTLLVYFSPGLLHVLWVPAAMINPGNDQCFCWLWYITAALQLPCKGSVKSSLLTTEHVVHSIIPIRTCTHTWMGWSEKCNVWYH